MLAGALVMWATQRPAASGRASAPPPQGAMARLPAAARAALDAGNAAFRRQQFDAALAQYRLAAADAPAELAPYFGIYMAAQALHDTALADSAVARIRGTSGGRSPAWSDSTLRALHGGPPRRRAPQT
jgi:hypothetical protein